MGLGWGQLGTVNTVEPSAQTHVKKLDRDGPVFTESSEVVAPND